MPGYFARNITYLIGVNLSEPHTSELNRYLMIIGVSMSKPHTIALVWGSLTLTPIVMKIVIQLMSWIVNFIYVYLVYVVTCVLNAVTDRGLTREVKMGRTDEYLSFCWEGSVHICTEKEQKYGHFITKVQWAQEYSRA